MARDEIEWLFGRQKPDAFLDSERDGVLQKTLMPTHVNHRISNMLAVVRSIARRTAATSHSLEDYEMNFDGRLGAYSRFLSLLPDGGADGLELGYQLAEEFLAAQAHEGDQVTMSGPPARFNAKAAEIMGLAFHELTTNAIKHGALGQPDGRIDVSWRVERDASGEALVFDWVEFCTPKLTLVPRRRGFGLELLEETLPFQLDARTQVHFASTGFKCQICLPVSEEIFAFPLGA